VSATAQHRRQTLKLHPSQQAFRRSDALYRGFVGGRGSGKTWAGAYDLLRRARRGHTYLIGSPTGILMHDITYPKFQALARTLGMWDPDGVKLTPYPTAILSTGAEVRFRTAEDPEKLRGPDLSGVWLDEASLMIEAAFDVAIGSLREDGEQGWLTATFTPKGRTHWTYRIFGGEPPRPNTAIFHSTSHDNPFLPRDFAAGLEQQYTGLRALQEVGGRFVNVEGAEWLEDYFHEGIWFADWPDPAKIVRSVLAIDTSKGRLRGDWQALVLLRLDGDGVFWCDAAALRVDEVKLLAKALELIDLWQPDLTVVESNAAGYYLLGQIARASIRGLRPAVIGRHHGSDVSKQARINTRLTSQWARGSIRLRKGSHGTRLLVEQARDFPEGEYDDLIDALEMGMELHGELVRPKDQRRVRYEVPR
jgi:phage terminase large subunit-like protein